jgi:hypothetical protein
MTKKSEARQMFTEAAGIHVEVEVVVEGVVAVDGVEVVSESLLQ